MKIQPDGDLDKNGDTFLDEFELTDVLETYFGGMESYASQAFSLIDMDNDGKLTLNELLDSDMMNKEETLMLLSLSDKNDDSVLDKSEWVAAEIAQEHKAVKLFIMINDQDKDGRLSNDEMANSENLLPGSGLTTRETVHIQERGIFGTALSILGREAAWYIRKRWGK